MTGGKRGAAPQANAFVPHRPGQWGSSRNPKTRRGRRSAGTTFGPVEAGRPLNQLHKEKEMWYDGTRSKLARKAHLFSRNQKSRTYWWGPLCLRSWTPSGGSYAPDLRIGQTASRRMFFLLELERGVFSLSE